MASRLEVQVGRPWTGLGGAYARGELNALRWYAGNWQDPDAWRTRAREVAECFTPDARARSVELLDAPARATREKLRRVAAGDGFMVSTGQQPGLFTGPGYTLLKALSTVALARWLEGLLTVPVVPVFWVASEDHDWAEVDHVDLVGADNELHRVSLPEPAGAGAQPLHRLPLGTGVESALDEFAGLLPQTEFTSEYLEVLRETWRPGVTINDGVRTTLGSLLGDHGVAFLDAADPVLKGRSVPVLEAELRGARAHEAGLAARGAELHASGWPLQVPILEEGVNLFVEGPAGRERLYRNGEVFRLRKSGTPLAMDDLFARLRSEPSTISPNVLLRPVVEASVLPTLGFVTGPGETAYHAQLAPLFASHATPQPLVFPRFSVTLVEGKVAKALDNLDLDVASLAHPVHELMARLAREEMPEPVTRALAELRTALDRGTAELVEASRPVDPTLAGPVSHARSVTLAALRGTERKILQAVKRRNETRLQQLEKARVHLFPRGAPQERVTSPLYYLVRYGPSLLEELLEHFARNLPAPGPADYVASSATPE